MRGMWNPAAALPWLVVAILAGCGKHDCERLYELVDRCSGSADLFDESVFVRTCKGLVDNGQAETDYAELFACRGATSCEAFFACGEAQRRSRRATEFAEVVAAGKWRTAFDACVLEPDSYVDPAFKALCARVFTTGVAAMTGDDLRSAMLHCRSAEAAKQRSPELAQACKKAIEVDLAAATDAARKSREAGTRNLLACMELQAVARVAGPDEVGKAATLCQEVDLAQDALRAVDAARANAQASYASVPYQCEVVDKLLQLGTPWAKRTAEETLKACYVELGVAIIAGKRPSATKAYRCPPEIQQVQQAADTYGLAARYPELSAALATVPKICR